MFNPWKTAQPAVFQGDCMQEFYLLPMLSHGSQPCHSGRSPISRSAWNIFRIWQNETVQDPKPTRNPRRHGHL